MVDMLADPPPRVRVEIPESLEDYLAITTLVEEGTFAPVKVTYRGRSMVIVAELPDLLHMLRDLDDIAARRFFDNAPASVRSAAKVGAARIRAALAKDG